MVLGVAGSAFYFSFFYHPPTCSDRIQNGDERGVDCDGSCSRLCKAPNVSVVWARSVPVAPGVYHAVALVKNPNTEAAGTVPYTVSLFDADNILVAVREGELPILPGESAPLFEANITTGERVPSRTFVDIGSGAFIKKKRAIQAVKVLSFDVDEDRARVTALLENQSLFTVSDITVTALAYDEEEIVRYASQTTLASLPARSRSEVTFTWQEPLSGVKRVDIIPRVLEDF